MKTNQLIKSINFHLWEPCNVMVDPAGRFFDNKKGIHNYSKPILEVGVKEALKDVNYCYKKFIDRDGGYDYSNINNQNNGEEGLAA